MRADKRHHTHRTRVALIAVGFVGAIVLVGLGPLACAGRHHISEAPPHPIAVEIQNNLPIPKELTVFLTEDAGGLFRMLGTVPGGKTLTFTYTPVAWAIRYRLKATSGAQPIGAQAEFVSPAFTVNDPNTGSLVWYINPNQVQFYDLPEEQAPAKDTTKAASPKS